MPLAQEIYQEGLRIPPVYLYREGVRQEGVWNLILANVRTPIERSGDLDAQLAALHAGASRLLEIVNRRGTKATMAAMDALVGYADRLVEAGLAYIELGKYEAEDFMDDDGFGAVDIPIRGEARPTPRRSRRRLYGEQPSGEGRNQRRERHHQLSHEVHHTVRRGGAPGRIAPGRRRLHVDGPADPSGKLGRERQCSCKRCGGERRDQPADHRCPLAGVRTRSSGPHSGTFPGHDEQHDNRRCGSQERSQFRLLRDSWGGGWVQVRPGMDFPVFTPICRTP